MWAWAGGQEGTLEQQWQTLGEAVELLAQAPEDEVTGQLLLLQAQLQQQAAANRRFQQLPLPASHLYMPCVCLKPINTADCSDCKTFSGLTASCRQDVST